MPPSEYLGHSTLIRYISYNLIARPPAPRIYTFSSWSNDSMFLLPSRDVDRTLTPIYNITVALNLNPFVPLSYVTTVRRGMDEQGELIGEFELAVMHSRAILKMGNHSTRMSNVLKKDGHSSRKFVWVYGDVELRWDCRTTLEDGSPMCICTDRGSHQVASFVPPPLEASPPPPAATLTVFPDGHELFDHILLSALVIERKMTLSF
ncbi:hypothetical protein DICSQDRAFT_70569 [Dichomitus squalens LYAD-421 SS1]|uniref:DUF6593 domain-containing protein n=1 Tax=Dichomitus squalens (strain LYAD-421) TaxID=732165 RepID=R7SL60_DICSQ|nr:uncharacterized protein DICSQDRAFT_70569 [Dichomitus squalens LYAD-421 SS1]EJF56874.1 hypothetical protein DICSQDRAFT_70569 [Dichomitus squalens LYAD-421 SS1]